jgi:cyclopropane fatty-acyl-phospholipid synthase-like methyltransferase
MAATSDEHRERIVAYYAETTEKSYLQSWAKGSFGFHFGLADEHTASLAESILRTNAFLADRANVTADSALLDAGCGVGGSSLWLAKERGARVTGITISPVQVDIGRRLAEEQGVDHLVRFECMDMCATTFDEAAFDVVWQLESLCHVEELEAYLKHVMFLLRDGGRFACIDLCRGARADEKREEIVCGGWCMVRPMRTIEEIASVMRRVGFTAVETSDLTHDARKSIEALKAMAHNTRPILEAERKWLAADNATYRGHVDAAYAIADGMLEGVFCLGHVRGTRPQR